MSNKPMCYRCNQEIDGEVVWLRPFSDLVRENSRTSRFIARVSTEPMLYSRPFHPKCFENWTGQKWPLESK